jgi:hypothetical protein
MTLSKRTLWESSTTRLVEVTGFKVHANFPFGRRGRQGGGYFEVPGRVIEAVMLHSLAGPFREGEAAVLGLANYHASNPKLDAEGRVVGGGRGWPGPSYHVLVPFRPAVVNGRFEVYQLWPFGMVTWNAGRFWNPRSISVGLGGMHDTRHAPKYSAGQARDPDPTQFEATRSVVLDYLLPSLGLGPEGLISHAEAGKVTCPGDVMEAWAYHVRGREVSWLAPERRLWLAPEERTAPRAPGPRPDRRSLETWQERQAALVGLGFDVGPAGVDGIFGYHTKSAVRAFQRRLGIVVDGVWGAQTEGALRLELARVVAPAVGV